jgi:integrase
MPLEFQRGSVSLLGKRRKTWYGKYRVCHKDPVSGDWTTRQKMKKIGLKSEMTKFEAEEKLREMIAEDNAIAPASSSDVLPKDLTLEWFVINRHLPMMSCRETTKKKTAYEIRRYILEQFGQRPLKEIGLFELQTHLNRLAKNFSDSVVRHTNINIRSIFNNAVDLEFIQKSPARRLRMPETRTPDKTVIGPSTILQLLGAIEDPMDRCALAVGTFCALRASELFGLKWESWSGEYLAITNTAFEGRLQENKVKTADSRGLVPVPDLVQPIIEQWKIVCPDTRPGELMFSTKGKKKRTGEKVPYDATNFMERRIHPVADKLSIPRRLVTFQVMRRTVGTDLQFYGTLKDAQAALRHKSAGTTANVYMQPVSSSVRAALNARTKAVFAASLSSGSGDQKNLENSASTPIGIANDES